MKLKPKDQLQLSNEELRRKMPPRILYPQNPRAPKNLTLFSFKDKMFKKDEQIEQTAFHLVVDGCLEDLHQVLRLRVNNWFFCTSSLLSILELWALLHIESQEALDQEDFWRQKEEEEAKRKNSETVDIKIEDDSHQNAEDEGRVLRNQFHYADRVSQTATKTIRERGVATKPPVTIPFSGTANPWIIYDAYVEELARQNGNDPDQKAGHLLKAKDRNSSEQRISEQTGDLLNSSKMKWAAKLTERVVNHNTESELYENFKSKEHPIWKTEGSSVFLPLWRFQFSKVKKKDVTALKWNPKYTDLFAAGFGNYEFQKQNVGYVCCYSLKNTLFPEYFWKTESAVCSLDWHPHNPSLLAVGLYDGTVVVFDVHAKTREPTHSSTVKVNKHTDPVWDVRWEHDNSNSTLQFYSVSEDGRVTSWSLMKNKLESEEVTLLKLDNVQIGSSKETVVTDPTALISQAAGTCFDFHPTQPHIFVVGTCEGRIFKCSKNYSGQYLNTYEGHEMSVTALQWNPFHPRVFISSSSDWTVKVWDHTASAPLLVFDVGVAVGDVRWAPYSSTIFAAAPADGTVHLYDLEVNRRARVGSYKIPHEPCLTKLAFNPHNTILIVGEAGGTVSTLKLSPTLNTPLEPADGMTEAQLRTEKLNTVFSMVSELFKSPQAGNQNLPCALQGVCDSTVPDAEVDTNSS